MSFAVDVVVGCTTKDVHMACELTLDLEEDHVRFCIATKSKRTFKGKFNEGSQIYLCGADLRGSTIKPKEDKFMIIGDVVDDKGEEVRVVWIVTGESVTRKLKDYIKVYASAERMRPLESMDKEGYEKLMLE